MVSKYGASNVLSRADSGRLVHVEATLRTHACTRYAGTGAQLLVVCAHSGAQLRAMRQQLHDFTTGTEFDTGGSAEPDKRRFSTAMRVPKR